MAPGDRKRVLLGSEDRNVATVSVSEPTDDVAFVVDNAALLKHVKADWPDGSTVVTETIRPSVLTALLADPWLPTGDLRPGLDTRPTTPNLIVRQSGDQLAALMAEWAGLPAEVRNLLDGAVPPAVTS